MAPSHYLNQWCWIDSWTLWNKLQWNQHSITTIFIKSSPFSASELGQHWFRSWHVKSDPKNHYSWYRMHYFISYMLFHVLSTIPLKRHHWLLILSLSPSTAFSDLALWCHHSWTVTSPECEVLAFFHHIHRLFLCAQIGAKFIFTNEYWFPTTRYSWFSM